MLRAITNAGVDSRVATHLLGANSRTGVPTFPRGAGRTVASDVVPAPDNLRTRRPARRGRPHSRARAATTRRAGRTPPNRPFRASDGRLGGRSQSGEYGSAGIQAVGATSRGGASDDSSCGSLAERMRRRLASRSSRASARESWLREARCLSDGCRSCIVTTRFSWKTGRRQESLSRLAASPCAALSCFR